MVRSSPGRLTLRWHRLLHWRDRLVGRVMGLHYMDNRVSCTCTPPRGWQPWCPVHGWEDDLYDGGYHPKQGNQAFPRTAAGVLLAHVLPWPEGERRTSREPAASGARGDVRCRAHDPHEPVLARGVPAQHRGGRRPFMGKVFSTTVQVSKETWDDREARAISWGILRDACVAGAAKEGYRPAEMERDYDNAPLGQPFECQWSNPLRSTWQEGEPELTDSWDGEAEVVLLSMALYCVRGEPNPAVNP